MESTNPAHSLVLTHEEAVLRNGELNRELAETRHLLWLAVKEAGCAPGRVTVNKADLPANYELEIFEPAQSPGTVIITAKTK